MLALQYNELNPNELNDFEIIILGKSLPLPIFMVRHLAFRH